MIGLLVSGLVQFGARLVLRSTSNQFLQAVAGSLANSSDNGKEIALAEIQAEMRARENVRDVRLATAGFAEMRVLAFLITLPFVVHLWAVALDTIFKLGWRIPAFPPPFDEHGWAIMLSYFGLYGTARVAQTLVNGWRR